MNQPKPESKLRGPEGVLKPLTSEELSAACMQATIIIPEMINRMITVIQEQNDILSSISLYFERRGKSEGFLNDDDFIPESPEETNGRGNTKA